MKSISFFLSNEPYKALRWWKLTEEESFNVDTANTMIFSEHEKKNTPVLSKMGYLESSAQPILADVVFHTLQNVFCAQILL